MFPDSHTNGTTPEAALAVSLTRFSAGTIAALTARDERYSAAASRGGVRR
jgi:hypothetical protein